MRSGDDSLKKPQAARAAKTASGSTLGSARRISFVATVFVQSAEPASGISSTASPSFLNQPIFMAMANGAAAELTVLAHQPTFTGVCAAAGHGLPSTTSVRSERMSERTFMA